MANFRNPVPLQFGGVANPRGRRRHCKWQACKRMNSSSEDMESPEESSCPSEWSGDGERSTDQEESDKDKDAEKYRHDRGEPMKVTTQEKQERRRKRKREDRTSSNQEETDPEEEGRMSQSKHKQDKKATPRDEGAESLRKERRKKLGSVKGDESSETVAGIIYLSRIPPFMKPHKVKHLLSRYGSVGRVYLKPEGQCNIYYLCILKCTNAWLRPF